MAMNVEPWLLDLFRRWEADDLRRLLDEAEIMKDDGKTAVNAQPQEARHIQEDIRDAEVPDHRRRAWLPRRRRGQAGRSAEQPRESA